MDAGSFWKLSQKNECYICDKHQFVHIYFEKGILAKNKDLLEIKDKDFLKALKKDIQTTEDKNCKDPIIRGSIVNGPQNYPPFSRLSFDRNLRMVRADVFAALCISDSALFLKNAGQS